MQLSLNWLKDFVDIPKKITPEKLGLLLTTHTVEVESIMKQADKYKNVVVGKILKVEKHPNADRLQIATVDIGEKEKRQIVCGAPNIAPRQFVPVALPGANLPNGTEIKEAEVRGVKSEGMLCAPDELGLGVDHSGILILEGKPKLGKPLADYLVLNDVIFEVDNKSITHRPDLWSHYGMAREIAVFLNHKLKEYKPDPKILESTGAVKLEAKVENSDLCPRYMAVALENIKIEKSPKWIEDRLIAAGLRPINNIVDVTNYVMLESGQPLHAFDMARIYAGKNADLGRLRIIVRTAKKGQTIETLDGRERELNENMLLIANEEKPLAVAGVMGGASSEINEETKAVVLESANFNFISVRKTARELDLRTDSSVRFEKALDPNNCETALLRAVELIKKLCPEAKVASNLVDEKSFKLNQGPIVLDLKWLGKRLGEKIETRKVIKILSSLGFGVEKGEHELRVTVPTWRATRDISIPEDLVEEVARIYGFDNLRPSMPRVEIGAPIENEEKILERKVKNILVGAPALTEVYNYSFVSEEQIKKMGFDADNYVRLSNPIASNQNLLRQNLATNLINNIRANQARFDSVGIFEIGSVFSPLSGDVNKDAVKREMLPYQEKHLGVTLGGDSDLELFGRLKGVLEYLFSFLKLDLEYKELEIKPVWADTEICAGLVSGGKRIGAIAKLDFQLGKKLGLKKEVLLAEMSFKDLFALVSAGVAGVYTPLEKYPIASRDLAFVINAKIWYSDIKKEIENFSPIIKKVELFDVYQGEKLGKDKKSLAFHVMYQTDRTLTAAEVDEIQNGLIKNLEEKFEAKIRDF